MKRSIQNKIFKNNNIFKLSINQATTGIAIIQAILNINLKTIALHHFSRTTRASIIIITQILKITLTPNMSIMFKRNCDLQADSN